MEKKQKRTLAEWGSKYGTGRIILELELDL